MEGGCGMGGTIITVLEGVAFATGFDFIFPNVAGG
jgi:hypothetical protein